MINSNLGYNGSIEAELISVLIDTDTDMSSNEMVDSSISNTFHSSSQIMSQPQVMDNSLQQLNIVPYHNLTDLVNVTSDVPIEYAMVMFGYIMPFLMIITIMANGMVVIVLSQKAMRTSTNIVLLAMAISDLLTLLFPAPWYFYVYTLGYHSSSLFPVAACYTYYCMTEVVPALFHTASIWLTLLLALQRYIYVCHPITARTWCTVPRVIKSMVAVFLLSLVHQSSRFFDRSFTAVMYEKDGQVDEGCRFATSPWVKNIFGENIYFSSYYGFRIIFVHILPCTSLVVLNLLLFKALRVAQRTRERLFRENPNRVECSRLRDSNSTTNMLIVIVTVFLATETPLAVCTLLHVIHNTTGIQVADYEVLNLTILFTNFFIMLTYPLNFAIYCGMSLQFRETFKAIFLKGNSSRPSPEAMMSRYSIANGPRTSVVETNL